MRCDDCDMNKPDIHNHLIYTTLTRNATTLYTTENFAVLHAVNNVNCSEIVGQELGAISASKTLVGSMPVASATHELAIFFLKKVYANADGSTDLLAVVAVAHAQVNRTLVLVVLKKIMDKYIEFRADAGDAKGRLGEFKLYMTQIIKFEEMNYDTNGHMYDYGSRDDDTIGPSSLVLVNEEVAEVRQLMLANIRSLMSRGDKIGLLVDQTDRLTSSSSVFRGRTQAIRRRMWTWKTFVAAAVVVVGLIYLILHVVS